MAVSLEDCLVIGISSRALFDLDDELAAKVMVLAKKMVNQLKDVLGCDGYNIVQNNEEIAGQTVFHFHLHIIPRYKDDGQTIAWNPGSAEPDELKEITAKIKAALK